MPDNSKTSDVSFSRRDLVGSLGVAASALVSAAGSARAQMSNRPTEWKPSLGILCKFSEANVTFAHEEGYTNLILDAGRNSSLSADKTSDADVEKIKQVLAANRMRVSAFQVTQNHIAVEPAVRERENAYFQKAIALAGKLGVPHIGTCSGKQPGKTQKQQAAEIVKVYNEKYFPLCEKNKVRICWEPWPGGPNIATSPSGFETLFNAFGETPWVGLQYDPSHLVWQMMDPIQTAKDFAHKIYDVHLKDTEIRWDVLRKVGINSIDDVNWWSYRLPGLGSIKWSEFFSVLQRAGYAGAMSIEHEDDLYGAAGNHGVDFTEDYKMGFRMAHRYLRQYVPE